jgi:hypothetical protein
MVRSRAVGRDGSVSLIIPQPRNILAATLCLLALPASSRWSQQAHLFADDATVDDSLGHSVAIDGRTLVVVADCDDTAARIIAGASYVYLRQPIRDLHMQERAGDREQISSPSFSTGRGCADEMTREACVALDSSARRTARVRLRTRTGARLVPAALAPARFTNR